MYFSSAITRPDTGTLSWPPLVLGRFIIECCQSIIDYVRVAHVGGELPIFDDRRVQTGEHHRRLRGARGSLSCP
jgi:hypothetical protein